MSNIFADNAMRYYDNGYNVLPLFPNTKEIHIPGWQHYGEEKLPDYLLQTWISDFKDYNIGVPLGPASGIIALDFDYDVDGLHKHVEALIDGSPVRKHGMKGYTAFYRYNGEHTKKWYKDKKAIVELLCSGTQTVLPPSIHPDTKLPYKWLTLDTLCDVKAEELPYLPEGLVDKVNEIFGYTQKIKTFQNIYNNDLPELIEIDKALSFIPSNDYATWINVGMALHHNYSDNGFNLWDSWSRKSHNYNASVMPYKWQSFGKYTGKLVTIATIFHWAIGYGYIPMLSQDVQNFQITFGGIDVTTGQMIHPQVPPSQIQMPVPDNLDFPAHLLNAPGLPGEIAAWVNSTSMYRQPVLALGAAVCAAGTLFAHRIKSESNLRTNFMALGIAESGAGKNHAREAIKSLFHNADLEHLVTGNYTADVALVNRLDKNNGVALAMMDEIGREMKVLTSYKAGGHEARLLTTMMEIYSEAGGYYNGKEYANIETAKKLTQPCLNIYGTTLPKDFFEAMTSNQAADGFLARWLCFESTDYDPPMQEKGNLDDIPVMLMENIRFVKKMRTAPIVDQSDPYAIAITVPCPQIVKFTESAEDILRNFSVVCNNNRIAEIKKNSNYAAIWARTREHAIKLALVAHDYKIGIIDSNVMAWGCELAFYLSNKAIKIISENVVDSAHQKLLNHLESVIRRWCTKNAGEFMTNRMVCQLFKIVDTRKRNELLQQLHESGTIEVQENKTNNKTTSYSYRIV